jgi:hypothetical protein
VNINTPEGEYPKIINPIAIEILVREKKADHNISHNSFKNKNFYK